MSSRHTASLAIAACLVGLLALAMLHLLRPDLEPSSHMISEYAIGPHGQLMTLSFAAFSVASLTLLAALVPHARGLAGRIGLGFLGLAGVGLAIGGAFPMDPTTTDQAAMSFSGRMHAVGFMIGVPGQLFAVLLLSFALRRRAPWSGAPLLATATLIWASVLVMVPLLVQQRFFGIPNRAFILACAIWMILAARPLRRTASASGLESGRGAQAASRS